MNESLYLSRAFVEFGPFPAAELLNFHSRGLLKESDYVRVEASDDWIHVNDWVAAQKPAPVPAAAPKATKVAKPAAKAPAKKAAAKKAAPAKKAAKKKS
ncbi:MAG: hypothetical protein OJI67_18090 [Prosthecobacter sp.]|nr:hypothetical protein [Prosthecobacter sp.]